MKTKIYVIRDASAIEFGRHGQVTLDDPYGLVDSSIWVKEHDVVLPEGFQVAETLSGDKCLYKDGEHYALTVDKDEKPVIVDHKNGGRYIHLKED